MNQFNLKIAIFMLSIIGFAGITFAQEEDFMDMSLEDLMNMEITSVSKKAERLQDVMSSIYVVSSNDIINSGATTLHEVLRLVPGYWGVQSEYSKPTSNIRYATPENGLTGTVLYLLDGTPIQNLMSSDFSFRNFDIPLDEIDRIEVIRGSGGTIYGANSATGVVNIFTKSPDKYDGVNARVDAASGGYINTTLRAGGKVSEKVALSAYAKMRMFNGFGSIAGTDENLNKVVTDSRYTEDYESLDMYSFGAKMTLAASESTKLSLNTHYNTLNTTDYSSYFGADYLITNQNTIFANDVNSNRLAASLRLDQQFSENNSLFARISTHSENDFSTVGGGYEYKNTLYDFEVQDNITLGKFNDLSIGGNYRLVNIEVSNINEPEAVNYTTPSTDETLKGLFLQDKIKFANGKFNVTLGIKAENYSLVNDEYYFSPMAKFNFIPTSNITVWGGYTQSYSTPGFNNTNVDLSLFQSKIETWTTIATATIYQREYETEFANSSDPVAANNAAVTYLSSGTGQTEVSNTAQFLFAQNPHIGVQNGSNTVPTRFRTWEIGFRANLSKKLTFESNFYHTSIADGIGINPGGPISTGVVSPTLTSRTGNYYLYGNYVEGTTYGTESTLKFIPVNGVSLELNHSFLSSEWRTQKNPDFDVADFPRDRTPSVSLVPSHVIRLKGSFALPANFQLDLSAIYATEYRSQANYQVNAERYENLAIGEQGSVIVSPNQDRTIVNLRLEKKMMDDKVSVYGFGQDIFNKGIQAYADPIFYATRHQIKGMYGLGLNYKFN